MNAIQLPAITDADRANAVRYAVERELGKGELTAAQWGEIKDMTLADLLAANTDALTDDLYEGGPGQDDITGTLTAIKAGSELLGTDFLARASRTWTGGGRDDGLPELRRVLPLAGRAGGRHDVGHQGADDHELRAGRRPVPGQRHRLHGVPGGRGLRDPARSGRRAAVPGGSSERGQVMTLRLDDNITRDDLLVLADLLDAVRQSHLNDGPSVIDARSEADMARVLDASLEADLRASYVLNHDEGEL